MTARCALYMGALYIRDSLTIRQRLLFPTFYMGFCSDRPYEVPTKFEVRSLPVPEIIGGTQKIRAVPGYAHAPFFPKFLTGFYSDWPCKYVPTKFEVRSFTRSWDNIGVPKKFFAISFQDIQPMWSQIINVTDGQTDRRTDRRTDGRTTCDRKTALCT